MFPLSSRLLSCRTTLRATTTRHMSQAATSGPDKKHVAIAVAVSVAAMGAVAYNRMQEEKNPTLRRRTTHCYPGFLPGDTPHGNHGGKKKEHQHHSS